MKAFGEAEKALPYYEKARLVYEKNLEKGDFMHQNWRQKYQ